MLQSLNDQQLVLHLKGILTYYGDPLSEFNGIIKAGLRLAFWGNSETRYTSCVFIEDLNMQNTSEVITEIIIFSGKSIDKPIVENDSYTIGTPGSKFAKFKILQIKGSWVGKIPQLDS
jgi:hypothetical protein